MQVLPSRLDGASVARLLEAIPYPLAVIDDAGRIAASNAPFDQLLGFDHAELVGQPVTRFVPGTVLGSGHRDRAPDVNGAAGGSPPAGTQSVHAVRSDGSVIPVEITLDTIDTATGPLMLCGMRDLTEHALASEALHASEHRFRLLADQATDGIFLSDAQGRYLDVNDAACAMLGYTREQLLRMSISDILVPAEIGRLPDEIARLASGEPVKSEWSFRRQDGSTFEGEVNSRRLADSRLLAVLRDVSERKRHEAAHLRAHRFIEAVAKASPSWIYVFDLDDQSLRYLNRSILRDLGYSQSMSSITSLEGFSHFLPPDDIPRLAEVLAAWRALDDDEVREAEYRIRRADGTLCLLDGRETVFARHPDGRVRQVLGTLDDVTGRKRAYVALQESEERFRTLVQELDVGVLLQNAADDRILLANRAAEEMLGIGAAELDHLSSHTWPWRLLREDGTDYPRDMLPSVLAARTGVPVRNCIVGSANAEAGICRWLQVTAMPRRELDGTVRHVLVTMTDVTARKEAEDALGAAREAWEHSFNALTDWVSVLDRDGRVMLANRAMRERFETRPGSLVGTHHHSIYVYEHDRSGADPCASVLAGGPSAEFTTTLANVEGHFVVSCYPLGGTGGAVHVVRDITRQRVLEEQLRQSQKLQAIGQLAGGVAHDFNNLLTVIISCSDLAMLELPPAATSARELITDIRGAADRAALLTRQLLLFGRRAAWENRVVDLNEVVRHADQMLRRVLGENVEVVTVVEPNLPATRGDAAQFEQVVVNLALNARDAMPNGGRLTIETHAVEIDEAACEADPAYRPGRFVRLLVSDTGVGMSPEVLTHAFEPFFTTKGLAKGTGLGLSTVYGIVEQAGGFVTVESTVGVGTTLRVFFPVAADQARPASAPDASERGLRGTETVLVVEDEPNLRKLIVRALESHGYRVRDVASAAEALALLVRDDAAIQMVLTDVVMPGLSGVELARRLRATRPDLPVLFMSGYSAEATSPQATVGPTEQLLQKPFTPAMLAAKVREMLDGGGSPTAA